ncbi:hypothetical protein H0H87_012618, partial [Tephrocybe sp. NHM501043]
MFLQHVQDVLSILTRLVQSRLLSTIALTAGKNLTVKLEASKEALSVLRDDWTVTDVRIGDIINALGTFNFAATSFSSITLNDANPSYPP